MALCIFRASDLTKMLYEPTPSVIQVQNEPMKTMLNVNHTGRYLKLNRSVERVEALQVMHCNFKFAQGEISRVDFY